MTGVQGISAGAYYQQPQAYQMSAQMPPDTQNIIQLTSGAVARSHDYAMGPQAEKKPGFIAGLIKGIGAQGTDAIKSLFTLKGAAIAAGVVALSIAFPPAGLALAGLAVATGGAQIAKGVISGDGEQAGRGIFNAAGGILGLRYMPKTFNTSAGSMKLGSLVARDGATGKVQILSTLKNAWNSLTTKSTPPASGATPNTSITLRDYFPARFQDVKTDLTAIYKTPRTTGVPGGAPSTTSQPGQLSQIKDGVQNLADSAYHKYVDANNLPVTRMEKIKSPFQIIGGVAKQEPGAALNSPFALAGTYNEPRYY